MPAEGVLFFNFEVLRRALRAGIDSSGVVSFAFPEHDLEDPFVNSFQGFVVVAIVTADVPISLVWFKWTAC